MFVLPGIRVLALTAMVIGGSLGGVTSALAQGEGTVRGHVITAADALGVSHAVVVLRSESTARAEETTTDADGRFSFLRVRPGEYVLATTREGFAPAEVRFVLEPREIRVATLALEVARLQATAVVTASLLRSEGTHSPSSTVLQEDRIKELPAAQRLRLTDVLLPAAPGMVRADSDFVHVRGHEIGLNLLINGVSFWENPLPAYSAGISPDVIETANVMTGGFSAEYGNRFGGVVDIVTKSGLTTQQTGAATITGGAEGRWNAAVELGGRAMGLGYFAYGSLFRTERFQSPPDPESIHNTGRGGHAFAQFDWNHASAGHFRGVLMGDGTSFEIPKTPLDEELRSAASADQETRQETATLGWSQARANLALGANFYQRWSRSTLNPASGPLTALARMNRELSTIGGKFDVTRLAGRHTIKAGGDLVRLAPDEQLFYDYTGHADFLALLDQPALEFDGPIEFATRESGVQISGYVQDTISLGSVTADLGIRLDRHDLVTEVTHASPRVNVAVSAGGGAIVHASYNHFFTPPPVEGVLSSNAGLTKHLEEIAASLPAIKPSVEHQLELGASAPVGPAHLGVTGYFRHSDNAVHTTVWPDSRVYSHASFDKVRAYGLETRVDLRALTRYGLMGHLNYALGRINYYNPVTGGFVTEAEHVEETSRFLAPMDQTHTLTSRLTYRHSRTGLWMGTAMEYGSGTPIEQEEDDEDPKALEGGEAATRVPSHFTVDLSFGIDLRRDERGRSRLALRVDLENVGNNVYLIAQESAGFTPAIYSIPRLASVTVKYRF
jgi:outer membrane receptor protein involved in Fe transport